MMNRLKFIYLFILLGSSFVYGQDESSSSNMSADDLDNNFNLVLGANLIVSYPGGLAALGWAIKAGFKYQMFTVLDLYALLEYSSIKSSDLVFSGSRKRFSSRVFPHLLLLYNKWDIQPYLGFGMGSGNFEINYNGNISKNRSNARY